MAAQVDYSLYVILDATFFRGRDPGGLAEEICDGGATVIQYRAKGKDAPFHGENVPPIREAVRRHGVPLLVNDDLDLALRFGADGVHLGQADLPITEARKRGGDDFIIGATVHSAGEAVRAIDHGADYLSVGSIFHTDTKDDIRVVGPGVLEAICRVATIPTIAIGGIREDRLREVLSMGPRGVAVVSAVLDSPDPRTAAHRLKESIDAFRRLDR